MLEKLVHIDEIEGLCQNCSSVAIGGQSVFLQPMKLVRELIKSGNSSLAVIASPVGGLGIDMLIGANVVQSLDFAQMSLWEYGMAPNMRRFAETGRIALREYA